MILIDQKSVVADYFIMGAIKADTLSSKDLEELIDYFSKARESVIRTPAFQLYEAIIEFLTDLLAEHKEALDATRDKKRS